MQLPYPLHHTTSTSLSHTGEASTSLPDVRPKITPALEPQGRAWQVCGVCTTSKWSQTGSNPGGGQGTKLKEKKVKMILFNLEKMLFIFICWKYFGEMYLGT